MSGRVGDLSVKQAEKLKQFKAALKDVLQAHHDDLYLLRFLRARKFDLRKTESMFRKDIEWRKKMDIDNLKREFVPPEVLAKYWGGGCIGFDKEGAPIWVDPGGKRDVKGLLKSCKGSDFVKFTLHLVETFVALTEEQNQKLGKDVGGVVSIDDMEGFSMDQFWKPWLDMAKKLTPMMEQHYPEILKKSIVINTPRVFSVLYAIFKPLLREETINKVIVLGSDWKTEILKHVDADILPAYLGGKRVDPDGDPRCPSVVIPAGKVPDSYYFQGRDISDRNLTTRVVAARGTLEFKYEVEQSGSVLNYEFRTKHADIAFSVNRIHKDRTKTNIVSKERFNCHISPEEGHLLLQEPGTYVLKFDNRYSLFRSKRLSYFVELLQALDDEEHEFEEDKDCDDLPLND